MRIFYPGIGPTGSPEFRLEQLEAIHRIANELVTGSKAALLGAGMGSGKTVVSAEVVLHTSPKRLLVVGVKHAYHQWADTFRDQGVTQPLLQIDGTADGRKNLARLVDGDDAFFYAGLEMLRAQDWEQVSETSYPMDPDVIAAFARFPGAIPDHTIPVVKAKQKHTYSNMKPVDLIISDESHRHSHQKSAAIGTMRSIPAVGKLALSGTFFGNKFINAWSLTTWLWGKKIIGTKGAFEHNYCVKVPVMTKDGRTQLKSPRGGFPLTNITGEKNPGEFVDTLPCYVFIATPIGPVPKPEVVTVTLSAEQGRQYNEMENQSLTWIPTGAGGKREPLIADLPIVQRIRLRTAALGSMTLVPGATPDATDTIRFDPGCSSSILDAAYDVLHRPDWIGKKVLILTHSKAFAKEVARRIGQKYSVALKTGDTKNWEKDKAAFMLPVSETGSVQYLVAVASAVGTATDGLQRACAKVLWLSEAESATENLQASNRIWRDGVDLDEYAAVKLVAAGTISEGILRANSRKSDGVSRSVGAEVLKP